MAQFTSKNITAIKAKLEEILGEKVNQKIIKSGSMKGYLSFYPKAVKKNQDGERNFDFNKTTDLKEIFGVGTVSKPNFFNRFHVEIYIGMEEVWNQTIN